MRSYAVIGLGRFGSNVAMGLASQGLKPVAIDHSSEKVSDLSEFIDNVYVLDATDAKALREAGVTEFDVAIVAMAELEASILCVMALKELKNRLIIAKAKNALHGEILAKVGAHKVVFPEREVARRLVADIASSLTFETMDVSNTTRLAKITITGSFVGKRVLDMEKLAGEEVRAVACKQGDRWLYDVDKTAALKEGEILTLIGSAQSIEAFAKRYAAQAG